jgi:hypothetical protein
VRTGAYVVAVGSEDGFAPDRSRPAGVSVALTAYHSADLDRNGSLNLFELVRVIELYNFRQGTVRTGHYHRQAGTEDGFASGPGANAP